MERETHKQEVEERDVESEKFCLRWCRRKVSAACILLFCSLTEINPALFEKTRDLHKLGPTQLFIKVDA